MATDAQIRANRENAKKSTGARTPEGHYASSRNAVTMGFYTQTDYVLPDEAEIYHMFCINFNGACNAVDAIEECLAAELTSAAWRLRRCNLVDGEIAATSTLDPLLDATLEKKIRSVERARAHSTSVFHRSLNQLRKLQKDRLALEPKPKPEPEPQLDLLNAVEMKIQSIMNCPEPDWDEIDRRLAEHQARNTADPVAAPPSPEDLGSNCKSTPEELGSNCKPAPAAPKTAPLPAPNYPRNAPCPCQSGLKFKRCCLGKVA